MRLDKLLAKDFSVDAAIHRRRSQEQRSGGRGSTRRRHRLAADARL